jgi:biopolymer transport protein ExbB/TolQ
MFKSNPVAATLVAVLFLSALASCWSATWWYLGAREFQDLEFRYQALQRTSAAMQSLANDALEYSKRNSSIDPLLQQFDLKQKPAGTSPAGQPTQKPVR